TEGFESHAAWKGGIEQTLADLLTEIASLADGLRLIRERLETDERKSEELAPLLGEVRGVSRRLGNAGDALARVLRAPAAGELVVRWIELTGKPGPERNIALHCVPLDLAPVL